MRRGGSVARSDRGAEVEGGVGVASDGADVTNVALGCVTRAFTGVGAGVATDGADVTNVALGCVTRAFTGVGV